MTLFYCQSSLIFINFDMEFKKEIDDLSTRKMQGQGSADETIH